MKVRTRVRIPQHLCKCWLGVVATVAPALVAGHPQDWLALPLSLPISCLSVSLSISSSVSLSLVSPFSLSSSLFYPALSFQSAHLPCIFPCSSCQRRRLPYCGLWKTVSGWRLKAGSERPGPSP